MPAVAYKTPGVYIQEPNSFPPSIVGVETAVPAFIGYTEKAVDDGGSSLALVPKRVTSMLEFVSYFGGPFRRTYTLTTAASPAAAAPPAAQPTPAAAPAPAAAPIPHVSIAGQLYAFTPSTATHLYLYDSLSLFYANGGGPCYIVSCGDYAKAAGGPQKGDLLAGLDVCGNLIGPTMLVIPDALLLAGADAIQDYTDVAQTMLEQCRNNGDRIALLDVFGADTLAPRASASAAARIVDDFRTTLAGKLQPDMLKYGAAYFPSLVTSLISASDIDLAFFDLPSLATALEAAVDQAYPDTPDPKSPGTPVPNPSNQKIKDLFTEPLKGFKPAVPADKAADQKTLLSLHQGLLASVPVYGTITSMLAKALNVLPASAAMAGIYTANDTFDGVWNAPANVGIAGMVAPTYALSGKEQDDLNVPINGMAVNAIRTFPGRGNLVWGARTLDGNSNDWRYIQVRRTMIYVEQSVKDALERMVFQPNTAQTWTTVTSMIEGFLHGLWAAGGLMGASPGEAFSVAAGLGSTMTPQDVLSGIMRVTVVLQMIHPAEFIELTFRQKMGGSA